MFASLASDWFDLREIGDVFREFRYRPLVPLEAAKSGRICHPLKSAEAVQYEETGDGAIS